MNTTTHEPTDMKLEIDAIPVSDVDRSKELYERLGWKVDADFSFPGGVRVAQVTPPGSASSITFGEQFTNAQGRTPDEAARKTAIHMQGIVQ